MAAELLVVKNWPKKFRLAWTKLLDSAYFEKNLQSFELPTINVKNEDEKCFHL